MKELSFSSKQFWKELEAFCQPAADSQQVAETVAGVIADIRNEGDKALLRYTEKFDQAKLKPSQLKVTEAELADATKSLAPAQRKAIRESIASVKDFHRKTLPKAWTAKNRHGAMVGERFYPIQRVGLYVPGGQVPLVSTVIMTAIPAVLAGCKEIVVTTPPQTDGSISPALLAALSLCGVKEIYRAGGIQAIAALGLGTQTIPAVDKVYGPGNAFVMEAKRQLFGQVGVDLLPGPSEVLVVCDSSANPAWAAADLLAQAEHGTGKEKVYLVSTSKNLLTDVKAQIDKQLPSLRHAEKIKKVFEKGIMLIHASNLDQAASVANYIAPEHMELQVTPKAQQALLKQITTAGAILLGSETPTVLGDFVAGPSHTLPTGRAGRFFSGLQVSDFMRRSSLVRYNQASLKKAADTVSQFSAMEQLDAHGNSLKIRLR